jgi:PAS domain S-box-containing protein
MSARIALSAVLQGTAALLQLTAAVLPLRLIRVTGWMISWLVISGALCVMTVRRAYSLWLLVAAGFPPQFPFDEIIALAISLLMLLGVITITPFLQTFKESDKKLRKTGRILVSQVAASTAQLQTAKEQLEGELRERRRAESALADEHQRLYSLLEALPAMVYTKAPDYTIRFANRRFREDWGNPEGRHCYEIFKSNEVCRKCVSLKVLETGEPLREEWVRPYGERVYEFFHYPFKDLDASPLVLTLGIDITGRKRMEEALRCSEEKYRLLVNQLPGMVFKGYADWSVDFFDNKIEKLSGYSKEDLDSRRLKWCDVILPEDLDYVSQVFLKALKSDGAYVREHRIRRKDGEIRWVQCWGQIFFDQEGKIDYISGVTFDITARKELEEILRQSEAGLRRLASQLLTAQEEERKRIARELHDELGQSLMIMKMKIRAIQRKATAEDHPLAADLKEMDAVLSEVVENVRRISRDLSPYILADLGLEAALQRLLEEFSKHYPVRLELHGEFAGLNQAFPEADQIHVYRLFQESLSNIGKHSGATGLKVAVSRGDGKVVFRLEDNGRGFDVTALQGSPPARGKGIGLATLGERARLLGGNLAIASEPGKGTKIEMVLPLRTKG